MLYRNEFTDFVPNCFVLSRWLESSWANKEIAAFGGSCDARLHTLPKGHARHHTQPRVMRNNAAVRGKCACRRMVLVQGPVRRGPLLNSVAQPEREDKELYNEVIPRLRYLLGVGGSMDTACSSSVWCYLLHEVTRASVAGFQVIA